MNGMLTAKDFAALVKRSRARVCTACRDGKLPGAVLDTSGIVPCWRIPASYASAAAYELAVGKPGRPRLEATHAT